MQKNNKTLILGGIKSGKSRLAEKMAIDSGQPVTLIATATAEDDEMAQRIERHQQSRPKHWQLLEEPIHVGKSLQSLNQPQNLVIIDCITLWLTNLLMASNNALLELEKRSLIDSIENFSGTLIVISNETSMGVIPLGELTRRYCDEAGLFHQALAEKSDTVILCIAGLTHYLKGEN